MGNRPLSNVPRMDFGTRKPVPFTAGAYPPKTSAGVLPLAQIEPEVEA